MERQFEIQLQDWNVVNIIELYDNSIRYGRKTPVLGEMFVIVNGIEGLIAFKTNLPKEVDTSYIDGKILELANEENGL